MGGSSCLLSSGTCYHYLIKPRCWLKVTVFYIFCLDFLCSMAVQLLRICNFSLVFFLSVEDIMALADTVSMNLSNANFDQYLRLNITSLCNSLKLCGQQLEIVYKGMYVFLKFIMEKVLLITIYLFNLHILKHISRKSHIFSPLIIVLYCPPLSIPCQN